MTKQANGKPRSDTQPVVGVPPPDGESRNRLLAKLPQIDRDRLLRTLEIIPLTLKEAASCECYRTSTNLINRLTQ